MRLLAVSLQAWSPMIDRDRLHDTGIVELILLGDCACAFGDAAALDDICRSLAELGGDVAHRALTVCRWADRDMVVATAFWEDLAAALRRTPAPEPAPGPRAAESL